MRSAGAGATRARGARARSGRAPQRGATEVLCDVHVTVRQVVVPQLGGEEGVEAKCRRRRPANMKFDTGSSSNARTSMSVMEGMSAGVARRTVGVPERFSTPWDGSPGSPGPAYW